jgi:hypothetical protein
MKKVKYWILIIIAVLIIVFSFSSIIQTIIVKYTGVKVLALVIGTPSECDRYNQIKVLLDSKEYEVNISRSNCRQGLYKVGQQVTLLKNENYKELIWPESQPELLPLLFIAALVLSYVSMKGRYKK